MHDFNQLTVNHCHALAFGSSQLPRLDDFLCPLQFSPTNTIDLIGADKLTGVNQGFTIKTQFSPLLTTSHKTGRILQIQINTIENFSLATSRRMYTTAQ